MRIFNITWGGAKGTCLLRNGIWMEGMSFEYLGRKFAYFSSAGTKGSILLMHGYSFNSAVWYEIGLVDALNKLGFKTVCLDVPGYPQSLNKLAIDENGLVGLLAKMAGTLQRPLFILGSSASAHTALKFAQGRQGLDGVIAVAPVSFRGIKLESIRTRALAIWGRNDDISPPYINADQMQRIPGARVEIMEGAGHACYLNNPKAFIKLISEFISVDK